MITASSWILLLFSLPTNRNTERVAVWRRLKKMGAVQIKTSTYLLPDETAQYEQFQWLAQQIRDYGGDSTLVRAQEIEGLTKEKLIAKFIDRKPKFVFAPSADAVPGAIPFDMLDAEFSHHGNYCTFETLTRRFAISDKVVAKIGEMIHDADLDDDKFQRKECIGIDRVLKGWAKEGLPDKEILRRGFECFDALYAFLQRR